LVQDLLVLGLVLTDVLLATVVFMVLARPDIGVGWMLHRDRQVLAEDELFGSTRELERLRRFSVVAGSIGLVLLGGWSFVVGAVMTIVRI
jgi:hypothetical protein